MSKQQITRESTHLNVFSWFGTVARGIHFAAALVFKELPHWLAQRLVEIAHGNHFHELVHGFGRQTVAAKERGSSIFLLNGRLPLLRGKKLESGRWMSGLIVDRAQRQSVPAGVLAGKLLLLPP